MPEQTRQNKMAKLTGLVLSINRRQLLAAMPAILALSLAAVVINHPHAWPLYMLLALWGAILARFRMKSGLIFATVFSLLTLLYAWFGGAITAAFHSQPGERLDTFSAWWGAPVDTVLAMLMGDPAVTDIRSLWLQGLLFVAPAAVILSVLAVFVNRQKDDDRATLHGSAQLAEPSRVRLTGHREGFLLGREKGSVKREVALPPAEVFEHILMVGAPGAGKSTAEFIPNLLRVAPRPVIT